MTALLASQADNPQYSITIDWLAFTFKGDTHEAAAWIRLLASDTAAMAITPTNGYRAAYRTTDGIVVQWNVDREEMGRHVIIAGSAIRHVLEYHELDQTALIQTVLNAGGSITRLDLAKDVQGVTVSLDEIYKAMERGEHSGNARSFSQIHSLGGGNTIYVGSRQSEKFIRIYDKAAQSQLTGERWYRFELETKGMVARALASLLSENSQWASAFATIALAMVDLPSNRHYRAFFADAFTPIGIPKLEKKSDREMWIETQVTPAVAKHLVEYPDSEAVKRLVALLDLIRGQGNNPE
jgi:hypothetical protein